LSMHGPGYLLPVLFHFIFIHYSKTWMADFRWTPLFH
jgi:hypothetical protein